MTTLEEVDSIVRPGFSRNAFSVSSFLTGEGADIGCGSCPLINPLCKFYIDQSPQPLAVEKIKQNLHKSNIFTPKFIIGDCRTSLIGESVDFIFSSHMLEDLENTDEMIRCLNIWTSSLNRKGCIALILPDMEGGRYPKIGDPGGNPSHRINIGPDLFMREIFSNLIGLQLVQIDHIPHTSESFDIVLRRKS
jgi:hypothetical protein